jgi:hypothetical protein
MLAGPGIVNGIVGLTFAIFDERGAVEPDPFGLANTSTPQG